MFFVFDSDLCVCFCVDTAAEAASVLDDRARVDELVGEALRIANQFGYTDLAENAIRVREEPGVLEQYRRAQTPPSLNHLSPAELDEYVEALIQVTHLSPSDAERVRPLLRHEAADLATLDAHREKECQYLLLLQDYSPPRIGPFLSELKWSVTCRMRGISSLSRGSHAVPLLQEFAAEVCSTCEFRAPGLVTGTNPSNADEAIYAPLLERFALR